MAWIAPELVVDGAWANLGNLKSVRLPYRQSREYLGGVKLMKRIGKRTT
jgi:hypothetical protein